ncbi:MAG: hypothetical protein RIR85_653, partial [Pseudomonadota bacterium]
MKGHYFLRQIIHAQATQPRSRSTKAQIQQIRPNPDRFKNLRPLITCQQRDAHLRENLQQPIFDR